MHITNQLVKMSKVYIIPLGGNLMFSYKNKLLSSILLLGAISLISEDIFAQSMSDSRLEEIVVTAQKKEEGLSEVPISIQVLSDEMIETMQTKFMPMIKSLGAEQCFEVQTSDTTVTIVTVYPDEATKTAASERIAEIRSQGADTFSATLVKAEEGPIVASI